MIVKYHGKNNEWLTPEEEYFVLEIFIKKNSKIEYRVLGNQPLSPFYADPDLFEIVDSHIPTNWSITNNTNYLELAPSKWIQPQFWVDFFDGEPSALKIYNEEMKFIQVDGRKKENEKKLQEKYQLNCPIIKSLEFNLSSLSEKITVLLIENNYSIEDVTDFSNLLAFNQDNHLIWKGKLPEKYYKTTPKPILPHLVHFASSAPDSFVNIETVNDPLTLKAFTVRGFVFDINVLTGEVTELGFTK